MEQLKETGTHSTSASSKQVLETRLKDILSVGENESIYTVRDALIKYLEHVDMDNIGSDDIKDDIHSLGISTWVFDAYSGHLMPF